MSGSSDLEVRKAVGRVHASIMATKRRPYIRSRYFGGDKIFLDYFWLHLRQKNWRDRMRRIKLFPAALDLIKNSTLTPTTKQNPNKVGCLHRFYGQTKDGIGFAVQITEDKNGRRYLMSIFPYK